MEPPSIPSFDRRASSMAAGSDSQGSVTAMDYINSQLALESEAREIMPYSFDTCTNPLGALRQPVFSCKTCLSTSATSASAITPGPSFPVIVRSGAAAICYSCSISCHGDHELVEIFNKRDVVCDCGTSRMPRGSSCALRKVAGEKPREGNWYCHNYWGRFCACDADYDPASEKGTMYQCLLGDACGEDWFHDGCIVGEKRDGCVVEEKREEERAVAVEEGNADGEAQQDGDENPLDEEEGNADGGEAQQGGDENLLDEEVGDADGGEAQQDGDENPLDEEDEDDERPNGFPEEDTFDAFICWLCVEKNPWLKRYAGTPGFLEAVYKKDPLSPLKDENHQATVETASPVPPAETPETEPNPSSHNSKKRKADDNDDDKEPDTESTIPQAKRAKTPDPAAALSSGPTLKDTPTDPTAQPCTYESLSPPAQTTTPFSLFLTPTFRTHFCHCPTHLPLLYSHPVLLEEEDTYEPPLDTSSADGGGGLDDGASVHSGNSLLDRGERALGMVDRVKAIEGVMAYNDLKEKVKGFLKPFAERGEAVGVEDVKRYFAELRGDVPAAPAKEDGGAAGKGDGGDERREQSGY